MYRDENRRNPDVEESWNQGVFQRVEEFIVQ
jgi:hypothetical protein